MNSRQEVEPPCLAASAVNHNFMEIDIDPPNGLPGLLKYGSPAATSSKIKDRIEHKETSRDTSMRPDGIHAIKYTGGDGVECKASHELGVDPSTGHLRNIEEIL